MHPWRSRGRGDRRGDFPMAIAAAVPPRVWHRIADRRRRRKPSPGEAERRRREVGTWPACGKGRRLWRGRAGYGSTGWRTRSSRCRLIGAESCGPVSHPRGDARQCHPNPTPRERPAAISWPTRAARGVVGGAGQGVRDFLAHTGGTLAAAALAGEITTAAADEAGAFESVRIPDWVFGVTRMAFVTPGDVGRAGKAGCPGRAYQRRLALFPPTPRRRRTLRRRRPPTARPRRRLPPRRRAPLRRPAAVPACRSGEETPRLARPPRRLRRGREGDPRRRQPRHARLLQQRPLGRLPHRRLRRTGRRLQGGRLLLRRQLSPPALFLFGLQGGLQGGPQARPAAQNRPRRCCLPGIPCVARRAAGGPLPPDAAAHQEGERRRGADLVDGERGALRPLPLFAAGHADAAEPGIRPADAGVVAGRDQPGRQPGPVLRRRLPSGHDRRPALRLRAVPDVARQPVWHRQLSRPRTADARPAVAYLRRRPGDVVRLVRPRGGRGRRLPRGRAGRRRLARRRTRPQLARGPPCW